MISLDNIHSLSDFKRNASNYVDQVRDSRSPIVLTVNGKAAVVVQDASAFQELLNHCQSMESEIREMKRVALLRDLQVGIDQLEAGEYTAYTEESLDDFFEEIKRDGRRDLGISA
jgi:prevent-host-death family protein